MAAYTMPQKGGGIAACNGNKLVGALVVMVVTYRAGSLVRSTVHLQDLVVDPSWEGKGIGSVLLGMRFTLCINYLKLPRPIFLFGGCAPSAAGFYRKSRFGVLPPSASLTHPIVGTMAMPPEQRVECFAQPLALSTFRLLGV